jgi:hypothetical protein
MPYRHLHSHIQALHQEVHSAEGLHLDHAAQLKEVLEDIQEALDKGRKPNISPLESAIISLEHSHPKITQLSREFVESCVNLGL